MSCPSTACADGYFYKLLPCYCNHSVHEKRDAPNSQQHPVPVGAQDPCIAKALAVMPHPGRMCCPPLFSCVVSSYFGFVIPPCTQRLLLLLRQQLLPSRCVFQEWVIDVALVILQ